MSKTITRSYNLEIRPNYGKLEDIKYSMSRYMLFLSHFCNKLYFNRFTKSYSTAGMGTFANQAHHRARGIIAGVLSSKDKTNSPELKFSTVPGTIRKSKSKSFDYWVNITSQWKNKVIIPVRSHRKLNEKLKNGYELSEYCEVKMLKSGKWVVSVFVSKEMDIPKISNSIIGVDVGIQHGVARSDGYLSKSLWPVIMKERLSQAERQRQGHKSKKNKTILKQLLNIEVTRVLRRSKDMGLSLAVEHPKVLSNLRIDRWARSYFANRVTERAIEFGVHTVWVNPAYTSITCSSCNHTDKKSRVNRALFRCSSCNNEFHADINAARNIALKGLVRCEISQKISHR